MFVNRSLSVINNVSGRVSDDGSKNDCGNDDECEIPQDKDDIEP